MSAQPVLEDEFKERDNMGLQDLKEVKTEAEERMSYMKLLLGFLPITGLSLSTGLYLLSAKVFGQKAILDKKFQFLHEYQLGYGFLAVWVVSYSKAANMCLSNGARAPARVDRPDQHVYKIMAASGPLKDAPYVMMVNTGPQGCFNRAQRAVFNADESMPVVLANTILSAGVYGPLTPCICLLTMYGRLKYTMNYKESALARRTGFAEFTLGEKMLDGLVLLTAIKTIFFGYIPF